MNNSKPASRSNRTSLTVNWPSNDTYFTVNDLVAANPQFVRITLTVRLDKAVKKDKLVACIGTLKGSLGAPSKVYVTTPVKQSTLDLAQNNGVELVSQSELMNVLTITAPQSTNITNPSASAVKVNESSPVAVSSN
jgi:hypothetical protein